VGLGCENSYGKGVKEKKRGKYSGKLKQLGIPSTSNTPVAESRTQGHPLPLAPSLFVSPCTLPLSMPPIKTLNYTLL